MQLPGRASHRVSEALMGRRAGLGPAMQCTSLVRFQDAPRREDMKIKIPIEFEVETARIGEDHDDA
jgi:hypothetical protein